MVLFIVTGLTEGLTEDVEKGFVEGKEDTKVFFSPNLQNFEQMKRNILTKFSYGGWFNCGII